MCKSKTCSQLVYQTNKPRCQALMCIYPKDECQAKTVVKTTVTKIGNVNGKTPDYILSEEKRNKLMSRYVKLWIKEHTK